jgi:hypothetical protein
VVGAAIEKDIAPMRHLTLLAFVPALMNSGLSAPASAAQNIPQFSSHAPRATPAKDSIVGTWLAVYDGGAVNNYVQWHKDGTAISMASFAPKTGNLLFGDWTKNQDGSATVSMAGWSYDDKGTNLTGHFTRSETDIVSGNSYSGTFEVTFYDLSGNIVFQHEGTLTATRVD